MGSCPGGRARHDREGQAAGPREQAFGILESWSQRLDTHPRTSGFRGSAAVPARTGGVLGGSWDVRHKEAKDSAADGRVEGAVALAFKESSYRNSGQSHNGTCKTDLLLSCGLKLGSWSQACATEPTWAVKE